MHEMPDLFRVGPCWYLLTTEYSSESKTVYRSAPSLAGPWAADFDDSFDGRAYYAARSASDGRRRFLFGWVATKEEDADRNGWQWGGTLVVHEVVVREDGSLGTKSPDAVRAAFGAPEMRLAQPAQLSTRGDVTRLPLGEVSSTTYRLCLTFEITNESTQFGLRFAEDPESGESYRFSVDPARRRLGFDRRPSLPWPRYDNRGLDRPIRLDAHTVHSLELLVDGTIAVLYLNDVALSVRIYDCPGTKLALDLEQGGLIVRGATVQLGPTPLN
jgi:beta-fructofuranosidase